MIHEIVFRNFLPFPDKINEFICNLNITYMFRNVDSHFHLRCLQYLVAKSEDKERVKYVVAKQAP